MKTNNKDDNKACFSRQTLFLLIPVDKHWLFISSG